MSPLKLPTGSCNFTGPRPGSLEEELELELARVRRENPARAAQIDDSAELRILRGFLALQERIQKGEVGEDKNGVSPEALLEFLERTVRLKTRFLFQIFREPS